MIRRLFAWLFLWWLRLTNPFRRVKKYVLVGEWEDDKLLPDVWRAVVAADPQVPKPKYMRDTGAQPE